MGTQSQSYLYKIRLISSGKVSSVESICGIVFGGKCPPEVMILDSAGSFFSGMAAIALINSFGIKQCWYVYHKSVFSFLLYQNDKIFKHCLVNKSSLKGDSRLRKNFHRHCFEVQVRFNN